MQHDVQEFNQVLQDKLEVKMKAMHDIQNGRPHGTTPDKRSPKPLACLTLRRRHQWNTSTLVFPALSQFTPSFMGFVNEKKPNQPTNIPIATSCLHAYTLLLLTTSDDVNCRTPTTFFFLTKPALALDG